MRSKLGRWLVPFAAGVVVATALGPLRPAAPAGAAGASGKAKTTSMAMQFAGQGRLEEHPPGKVDGVDSRAASWSST